MGKKAISSFGAGLALIALTLAACGSSSSSKSTAASASSASSSVGGSAAPKPPTGDPILIGATTSDTGALAGSDKFQTAGYEAAVDELNAEGGVLGRPLKFVHEDDQSSAGNVVPLYTKLITVDKVNLLLAPYGSTLSGPAAQLAEKYKIPMVHPTSTSPAVFQGTKYNFQGFVQAKDIFHDVPSLVQKLNLKTVGLISNDLAAVVNICVGAQKEAQALGLNIVFNDTYAATTTDFSSVALKIKAANPDALIACNVSAADGTGLFRALAQQGFTAKMRVATVAGTQTFRDALGPTISEGIISYGPYNPAIKGGGNAAFMKAYAARMPTDVDFAGSTAYADVQALVEAVKTANSLDATKVSDAMRAGHFETVLGTWGVDPGGLQTGFKTKLGQVQNGKYVLVYPPDAAVASVR